MTRGCFKAFFHVMLFNPTQNPYKPVSTFGETMTQGGTHSWWVAQSRFKHRSCYFQMCLTPMLLATAHVVVLKICPQTLWYSSHQEVESRFPSPGVWARLCDSFLLNRIKWKWRWVTLETRSLEGTVASVFVALSLGFILGETNSHVLSCPVERPTWKECEGFPQPVWNEELRPPVQTLKPLDNNHHDSDLGGGAFSTSPASEWLQSPPHQQLGCSLMKDLSQNHPAKSLLGPSPRM